MRVNLSEELANGSHVRIERERGGVRERACASRCRYRFARAELGLGRICHNLHGVAARHDGGAQARQVHAKHGPHLIARAAREGFRLGAGRIRARVTASLLG